MYTVPNDVPLDMSLDVEIEILGEFDKTSPKSFLLLIKERGK